MRRRFTATRIVDGAEQTSAVEVGTDAEAVRTLLAMAQEVMPADFPRPAWLELYVELARTTIAVEQRTGLDATAVEVMVSALKYLRQNPPPRPA